MRALLLFAAVVGTGCSGSGDPAGEVGGPLDAGPIVVADTAPTDPGPSSVQDTASTEDTAVPADAPATPDPGGSDSITVTEDPGPTGDLVGEDPPLNGPLTWIRITDDPENESLQVCLPFNSPGADIDAVELYRNGELLGYATEAVADLNKDVAQKGKPCDNDYGDGKLALGPPDAGTQTGSVSLGGGQIMLQLADGATIMAGDVIKVHEAGLQVVGVPERFFVAVGTTSQVGGPWIDQGVKLEGTGEVTVSV